MSWSTLIFILILVIMVGVGVIKESLRKTSKAVIESLDNTTETVFTASKVSKIKAQAYMLEGIEDDIKKVSSLKNKYPDFFID